MKGDCNADAFLSASTAFKKTYPRYLADNVSEIPASTIFYSLISPFRQDLARVEKIQIQVKNITIRIKFFRKLNSKLVKNSLQI